MKLWIAFWNILVKDMRTYYLKPPNISWGLIFPLAWTGMFFIKSGSGPESILTLLPGLVAVSILFGTTSMLAVTVTFSNFFRFPMIFLCGLFFPIEKLPVFLKPLSYALPLTYGADVLPWSGARRANHAPCPRPSHPRRVLCRPVRGKPVEHQAQMDSLTT